MMVHDGPAPHATSNKLLWTKDAYAQNFSASQGIWGTSLTTDRRIVSRRRPWNLEDGFALLHVSNCYKLPLLVHLTQAAEKRQYQNGFVWKWGTLNPMVIHHYPYYNDHFWDIPPCFDKPNLYDIPPCFDKPNLYFAINIYKYPNYIPLWPLWLML